MKTTGVNVRGGGTCDVYYGWRMPPWVQNGRFSGPEHGLFKNP